jgi:hypothetical protein
MSVEAQTEGAVNVHAMSTRQDRAPKVEAA